MDKLPKSWSSYILSDVCDVRDGTHDSPKYFETGYPLVTSKNLKPYGLDLSNVNYISTEDFETINKRSKVDVGDVLFAMIGTIGNPVVVKETPNFAIKNMALFKPYDSINSYFLLYYLSSPFVVQKMNDEANGATQRFVGLGYLRNFPISLPTKSEQIIIVNKLDALFNRIDKSITLLEENIKYSQALKNSIIENTFIKLLNHSKTFKIKEIAEIKGGKRLPKGETVLDEKTDYPYIRVTDFNDNGSIDLDNLKYLNKEVQEQIKRYIITSKDLYISIAGTIGKTGIIPKELDNANLTENAARLVFKSNLKINNRFIYYFTLSNNFKEQVGLATKTVAQPKLALTRLAEVEIPIPSIELQDKEVKEFDLISSKTNEILKHQHSQLTYLKALKASILDKAFKGEL